MNDVLELEIRRKIYDIVAENPGLHLSKIAELLNMRVSLAEYHLIQMAKNQVVFPVKESGYTRYYVKGKVGTEDKRTLALLRQEVPLRIILLLLKQNTVTHKEILKNLDVAPSTLSYHLKKLITYEIIGAHNNSEEHGYFLNNREHIAMLLIIYSPYNLFESFKDVWINLTV